MRYYQHLELEYSLKEKRKKSKNIDSQDKFICDKQIDQFSFLFLFLFLPIIFFGIGTSFSFLAFSNFFPSSFNFSGPKSFLCFSTRCSSSSNNLSSNFADVLLSKIIH